MVMDMLKTKKQQQVKGRNIFSTTMSTKRLSQEEIRQRIEKKAYQLFEQRGYAHGNDLGDWFEAERLVKAEIGN